MPECILLSNKAALIAELVHRLGAIECADIAVALGVAKQLEAHCAAGRDVVGRIARHFPMDAHEAAKIGDIGVMAAKQGELGAVARFERSEGLARDRRRNGA